MDKKLILYLAILAGLIVALGLSLKNAQDEDASMVTMEEKLVLEDTGYFEINESTDELEPLFEEDDLPEEAYANVSDREELQAAYDKYRGVKTGSSPLLTFGLFIITGIFVGFLVVTYVLPAFVQRASEEVLGSTESVGQSTPTERAQGLVAQGDWDGAIAAYQEAAEAEPDNRLPWVEIAMLQLERKEDPDAAIATLNEALQRGEWRENDEAFFIFRKIEIHETRRDNHERAVELLHEVIEKFPNTRHSANANHKLREYGAA